MPKKKYEYKPSKEQFLEGHKKKGSKAKLLEKIKKKGKPDKDKDDE